MFVFGTGKQRLSLATAFYRSVLCFFACPSPPGARGAPALWLPLGLGGRGTKKEMWGREDVRSGFLPCSLSAGREGLAALLVKDHSSRLVELSRCVHCSPSALGWQQLHPHSLCWPRDAACLGQFPTFCFHLLNSSHDPIWMCPLFVAETEYIMWPLQNIFTKDVQHC